MLSANPLEASNSWRVIEPLGSDSLFERWLVSPKAGDDQTRYILSRLTGKFQPVPGALEALREEAEVASQLYHPNLPRMYPLEEAPGGPYLVQEAPAGVSLRTLMAFQTSPLPAAVAAEITRQLCEAAAALAQATTATINGASSGADTPISAHLNLCSDNICIDLYGDVKLLSLGVTAGLLARRPELRGTLPLSPLAAPEVSQPGQPLSQATTQYAIGVVAFELLTGVSLSFELEALARQLAPASGGAEGASSPALLIQAQRALPSRLHEVTRLPAGGLNEVLSRMLAWNPNERFPSLQDASTALLQAAWGVSQGGVDVLAIIGEAVRLIRTDLPPASAAPGAWLPPPDLQAAAEMSFLPATEPPALPEDSPFFQPDHSGTQELPSELSHALLASAPPASNLLALSEELAPNLVTPEFSPNESTFVADPLAPPPRATGSGENTASRVSGTGEVSQTGSLRVSSGRARVPGVETAAPASGSPIFGGAAATTSVGGTGASAPSGASGALRETTDPYGPTQPRTGGTPGPFPPPPGAAMGAGGTLSGTLNGSPGGGAGAYGNSGFGSGPTHSPPAGAAESNASPVNKLLAQFQRLPRNLKLGLAGGLMGVGLLGSLLSRPTSKPVDEPNPRADIQLGDNTSQNGALNGRVEEPLPGERSGESDLARAMAAPPNSGGSAGGETEPSRGSEASAASTGGSGGSPALPGDEENHPPTRGLPETGHKLEPEILKPFNGKRRFGFGSITIDTSPPDSLVILDGRDKQRTPITFEDLPAGEHQLVLRNDEYGTRDVVIIDLGNGEGFSGTWSYQSKKFMSLE